MKSRPYPLNVLLYLLLLYLRTYYTYWWTYWCMYVPTVPTTAPTVRARTIATAVQYVLRTDIRTNCTADIRTYIYIEKIRYCRRIDRYLLHLHSVCTYCTYNTDARTACTYCWYTHVYWRKKLLKIRTYCGTYVPTLLTWYSCTCWCTYAPTALTAAPTGARTYPP